MIMLLFSCGTKENPKETDHTIKLEVAQPPSLDATTEYTLKPFEVVESGRSMGWGYDIYINGQRTIHQPSIPAVSGIHYFSSEKEAHVVGQYAIKKMKQSGSFPTLTLSELDSLGIKI
jgi:hypothetical protein